ncbi:MAG: M24 family metallopeptidase, partial [Elusimicrobia bacterium]|nr:M24 family metallopeptidase [Elusimicrobiota bacterium]
MSAKTVEIKSAKELALMRRAGAIVAQTLQVLSSSLRAGMTTLELDQIAMRELAARKAKPAFLGYHGFPACLCVSLNKEVVHGIPSAARKVADGDLVSLDFGCVVDGFYSDAAVTLAVGRVPQSSRKLVEVTRESLGKGIEAMRPGN